MAYVLNSDQVNRAITADRIASYVSIMHKLEELTPQFIVNALLALGLRPELGDRYEPYELVKQLNIKPVYHKLIKRLLDILEEEQWLVNENNTYQVCKALSMKTPCCNFKSDALKEADQKEIALFIAIAQALPKILVGDIHPLELLFPKGDITTLRDIYCEALLPNLLNQETAQIAANVMAQKTQYGHIKVLELGAGTGSVTKLLLPKITAEVSYYFTDVTNYFILQAKKLFTTDKMLNYQLFNLNENAITQGIPPDTIDIVIAANVLHVAKDLPFALSSIYSMLKPGGNLIFLECRPKVRKIDVIFGVIEDWWSFEDNVRTDGPIVPAKIWLELLKASGFREYQSLVAQEVLATQNEGLRALLEQQYLYVATK